LNSQSEQIDAVEPFMMEEYGDPYSEEAFQRHYRDRGLPMARGALIFAIILIVLVCIIDRRLMPVDYTNLIIPLRFMLMILPLGLALLVALTEKLRPYVTWTITLAAFVTGIGTVMESILITEMRTATILWGTMFFTFYPYLVLGLRARNSAIAAIPFVFIMASISFIYPIPPEGLSYALLYMLFSNAVGLYSSHRLETAARDSYRYKLDLKKMAETDGLTRLYNRRILDEILPRIWRHADREKTSLGLLLIDIDFFKQFNDHYGHQAGDDCLRKIAAALKGSVRRPLDYAARYGGEEFLIVLYAPTLDFINRVIEEFKDDIQRLEIKHEKSTVSDLVTVSVGAGLIWPSGDLRVDSSLKKVDDALYLAKADGRDRSIVFEEPVPIDEPA
jgi:diguanylate cyclase (GGDEF)-like protein